MNTDPPPHPSGRQLYSSCHAVIPDSGTFQLGSKNVALLLHLHFSSGPQTCSIPSTYIMATGTASHQWQRAWPTRDCRGCCFEAETTDITFSQFCFEADRAEHQYMRADCTSHQCAFPTPNSGYRQQAFSSPPTCPFVGLFCYLVTEGSSYS
jgi:hypothetical protein